jgi:hypothetical protein
MICLECKQEMKKIEPEQTWLVAWKADYVCHKCGIIVQITKNQDASGADIIAVTRIEQKDATG